MKRPRPQNLEEYPFASELITDIQGQVNKVILDFQSYQKLLETLEDVGLYRAMQKAKTEKVLTKEEALELLNEK